MWTIFTTSTQVGPSATHTALKGISAPSPWAGAFWESQGAGPRLGMFPGENGYVAFRDTADYSMDEYLWCDLYLSSIVVTFLVAMVKCLTKTH